MLNVNSHHFATKSECYKHLNTQLMYLIEEERDLIANASNAAALLFHTLPDVNWAGFYFNRHDELVLGPFQGKPACVRIAMGKGVCGTCAQKKETVIVKNVHEFPGHIACDSASHSEIVIPIVKFNKLIGLLDVDSPLENRFDHEDKAGLETFIGIFCQRTNLLL
ncbi:GAF domain-containing protein [bacterium]|nr:GAF domain-containing protein [bacterium]